MTNLGIFRSVSRLEILMCEFTILKLLLLHLGRVPQIILLPIVQGLDCSRILHLLHGISLWRRGVFIEKSTWVACFRIFSHNSKSAWSQSASFCFPHSLHIFNRYRRRVRKYLVRGIIWPAWFKQPIVDSNSDVLTSFLSRSLLISRDRSRNFSVCK